MHAQSPRMTQRRGASSKIERPCPQSTIVDSMLSTTDDELSSTMVDMGGSLGDRLRAEREAAKLTQEKLADEAGVSKQAVSKIELGATQNPEAATLSPIAERLNLRETWLLTGRGQKHRTPAFQSNVEVGPDVRPANLAPVTGRVRGGDHGYIEEEQNPVGYSDELVPYHGIDPNAFGLRVIGDSMHPRYKHGEYIVACPNLPVRQGHYVYVTLHDGRKLVKELGKDHGDAYDFHSVNQEHKVITLEKAKIAGLYRVYGPVEPDAIVHR